MGHVFGGHLHTNAVGGMPWEGGGGETVYACQTCVYFDEGGPSGHYPGYRLVRVEDGEIASFSYLDGKASHPLYDGCLPGAVTDLDLLERPSIWLEERRGSGNGAGDEFLVGSYLACPVELRGSVVETAASPSGSYEVEGAEIIRAVALPGEANRVLLYLKVSVGAGIPGEAGDRPGTPALKTITVISSQDTGGCAPPSLYAGKAFPIR